MSKRQRVESSDDDVKQDASPTVPSWALNNKAFCTAPAPAFNAEALMADGSFSNVSLSDFKDQYLVLFFYPLDWTFVCPTEISQFSDRAEDFKALNCAVVGASVDSVHSHLAWTKTERKTGGLGKLAIPLIGDIDKKVSSDYGCLIDGGITLRGLFIIDSKGVIRHITKNDPPVGRNVDEVLRLVKAYQFTDKHGEVCPVNWQPGAKTIKPNPKESKEYFGSL